MRIAIPVEGNEIFQHFGRSEAFKFYDVEDGKIVREELHDNEGSGHGALAGILQDNGVDVLICGGIGPGAQEAIRSLGIKLAGSVSGPADEAAAAYIAGTLAYEESPEHTCGHHDHEEGHTCGDHGCGEHDCGSHGCGGHDAY